MEVRLFGELEAVAGGVPVPVRGAKQRALLALLALQRGQPVSADRLSERLDRGTAGPRDRVEVDARLRTRWLRQDDAARRVADGGTRGADQAGR
jgi:hypothetical protein